MPKKPAQTFVEREPKRVSRTGLSRPKLGGAEQCRELVSALGGIHLVSTDFKIDPDLLNRYMTGQIEVPYTVLLAFYWQSDWGFKHAFEEAHWTHNYNSFRRAQAEEKVKSLERVVGLAVALLEHRPDAADLMREVMAEVKKVELSRAPGMPIQVN